MALDGEPKDGDFVRYIEMLNRQAGGSPGQVPPRQRGVPRGGRRGAAQPADAAGAPAPAAPGSPAEPAAAPPTLAARTGQRRIALGLTIAGMFALWHAVSMLVAALDRDTVDIDDLIPVIFLAVCAFMLFKGGSRLRSAQTRAPLPKLPPLSTLPGGKKRQA
ncbi:hypothetical protein [Bordetella petrii]|uniref:hypothetical protein n=1 Tax=Bordetella petrii TaxID=94624 RepID=UPI001A968E2B|nr:hypothetical protein [Bordetella petrii]MBO1111658.1 hypothetical protein [Bordetella petrii]